LRTGNGNADNVVWGVGDADGDEEGVVAVAHTWVVPCTWGGGGGGEHDLQFRFFCTVNLTQVSIKYKSLYWTYIDVLRNKHLIPGSEFFHKRF
jgi:hypothetical protein